MIRNFFKTSTKQYKNFRFYTNYENTQGIHNVSTVDQKEIHNFKNLVKIWWDENGEMKPLHSMNVLRVPFVRDGLKNEKKLNSKYENTSIPLKGLNILDAGCGGGILTEPLARLGATVVGIDACKDLIECAKYHSAEEESLKKNLSYVFGTMEDFSKENISKFDAVVSSECVEHVNSVETFLKSCTDVLKPGGSLFITTLNRTTLSWIGAIILAENILNIVPKGVHDWNKFVTPHEIEKTLEHCNCQTRLVHGIFYNFLTNNWFWIPDESVSYALHAVKTG